MEANLTTTNTAMAVQDQAAAQALNFFDLAAFKDAYHIAGVLAKSQLIPKQFQNNVTDCIIAMEMAQRIGAGVFAVMQSLYVVHGRPGWSAAFIIAALNSCGRFAPLRFEVTEPAEKTVDGKKIMDRVCTAWTLEKGTGQRLEGPPVSIEMAHREGWYGKPGSKWQTMPELMLRYRAATFFGRLYAPDVLMGMRTAEELADVPPELDLEPVAADIGSDLNSRFGGKETIDMRTGEIVAPPESKPTPPRAAELKEAEQKKQAEAPATVKESLTVEEQPPLQQEPPPESNDAAPGQEDSGLTIDPRVKAFMREINQATTGGSIAVDTWRAKHHKRVAAQLGDGSALFAQVMQYADDTYKAMVEAEQEQKKAGGNNDKLF